MKQRSMSVQEEIISDEIKTSTYSCPRGLSCEYPASCYVYEDSNENGECDHEEK